MSFGSFSLTRFCRLNFIMTKLYLNLLGGGVSAIIVGGDKWKVEDLLKSTSKSKFNFEV